MNTLERFTEQWMEEFGRAVEMFTGEKASLSLLGQPAEQSEEGISTRTWWKQTLQGDPSASLWAGATESVWKALAEGDEAQSSFFEILSQSNQATVAALSAGLPVPLRVEDGLVDPPSPRQDAVSTQINITFKGVEAGVVVLLLGKTVLARFASLSADDEPASVSASPAMLWRLMDLQLPVSVLLGRASITIKDALKLISGSVVELDRRVGDHVEIMVHGTIVAKGEIVSVKGNYGVRIKEVISRQDRMALHEAA